tara:strand:+ start:488 stop:979 length:492 start_codon:yes stop_codon:yes gene_type:complete
MNIETIINNTPTFLLFVYVCVCLGGAYFMFVSIPKAITSRKFPTVQGKITSGGVGVRQIGVGRSAEARVQTFTAEITYKYVVNEKTYTSNKRRWHEAQTTFHSYHQRISNRYPQGKEVKVYYNPAKPKVSVLEPGIGLGSTLGVIITLSAVSFLTFFISQQYS